MKYDKLQLMDFTGGLNNAAIASKIADNQLAKCLNFEYDPTGTALSVRRGTRFVTGTSSNTNDVYTSVYGFLRSSRTRSQFIRCHANGNIFGENPNLPTNYSKLNDGITLSTTLTDWQWATFTNLAIGVNGDTVNVNPFKWNGTDEDGAQLGGTAPKGRYIATWNSRVWIAKDNTLYFSKLGDAENWTATGVSGSGSIEVGYNDGDLITGLAAHGERLFIFKRNHIYQIITANPNTDPTIWRLELLTKDGGCISARTIQPFGPDLLFLSDDGLASLNAMNIYAPNFTRAVISRYIDIPIATNRSTFASVVLPGAAPGTSYYMLFTGSQNLNDTCYVMDTYVQTPIGTQGRWVQFEFRMKDNVSPFGDDGIFSVAGATIAYSDSGKPYAVLASGRMTTGNPLAYCITFPAEEGDAYHDSIQGGLGSVPYTAEIKSKAFSAGSSLIRKAINRYGFSGSGLLGPGVLTASVDASYILDQDLTKIKTNTATLVYGSPTESKDFCRWFRCSGFPGRRANEIQISVKNNQTGSPGSAFVFKELMIEATEISHRHSSLK